MFFSHENQEKLLDIQIKFIFHPHFYTKFPYFSDVNWKAYILTNIYIIHFKSRYYSFFKHLHQTKEKNNKKIPCREFSVSSARRTPIRILLAIHLEASGLSRSRVAGLCSHRNDDLLLRFVNFGLDTPLELHNRGCYGDVYLVLLKV